jgi:hypothetical protein
MAESKKYAYFIKGGKLGLVESSTSEGTGLEYADEYPRVTPGSRTSGLSAVISGFDGWVSPKADLTNGIEIEYTSVAGENLSDESSEIPVSDYLAKALIYYIKARLSEAEKDFQTREYYMKQFYKGIEKNNNAKIYGARRVSPGNHRIK